MLDERWIKALHVETMRAEDLHAEREHHVLFQASTIGALLDGAYEGDLPDPFATRATSRTPFAVVTDFEPSIDARLDGSLDHAELLASLDEPIPAEAASCAIRIDGRFDSIRARSVPRQSLPTGR